MQRQQKSKKKSSRPMRVEIPRLAAFQASIQIAQTFRFQAKAAFLNTAIFLQALFDMLNVAETAVTATQLLQSLKFKEIRMWGPPASSLIPVTVSVEFPSINGGAAISGPTRVWSDTSIGATEVAFVQRKPVKGSYQSFWQAPDPAATGFLTISGPANTVIEIQILGVLLLGGGVTAVANAPVGAVPGQIYVRGLDGLAAAGTNFPPLSYPTD